MATKKLLREIPEPQYEPPIEESEAEAIRAAEAEEAALRAAEKKLDPLGRELMDPTPMEPPIGYNPQPTLVEQMRAMIAGERLRQEAMSAGYETFEEADDFELEDDPAPASPYEQDFEPPVPVAELRRRAAADAENPSSPPKPLVKEKSPGDQPGTATEAAQPPKSAAASAADAPSP